MTEQKKPAKYGPRKDVDWAAIKRHWCANKVTDTELSARYEVSRAAISKRSQKEGWVRDIADDVDRATQMKIAQTIAQEAQPEVAKTVTQRQKAEERAVVEAYSDAAAAVDGEQRADVKRALRVQRSMLEELEQLTRPEFAERLEWLGKVMDESGPTPSGGWKTDKINELYQYVISLGGRIKMAKELGAAHGVYLPLQRKMFKLDEGKSQAPFEDLLARLGSAQQESS